MSMVVWKKDEDEEDLEKRRASCNSPGKDEEVWGCRMDAVGKRI